MEMMESECDVLDGYYGRNTNSFGRAGALGKCLTCASQRGYEYFALQAGGQCFASSGTSFQNLRRSTNCKDDGKGGGWANNVYQRTGWCV